MISTQMAARYVVSEPRSNYMPDILAWVTVITVYVPEVRKRYDYTRISEWKPEGSYLEWVLDDARHSIARRVNPVLKSIDRHNRK